MVVAVANAGLNVPTYKARFDSVATDEPEALVAVILYVLVVAPSCAVHTMVMRLSPALNGIDEDAAPDATVTPLTFMVAVASCAVGVMVRLLWLAGIGVV